MAQTKAWEISLTNQSMASQCLFCQKYATRGSLPNGVLDFDYKHINELTGEDRKWVKVSVYLRDMTLDYENVSREHSGSHGNALERGVFSNTSHLGVSRHQILFQEFHSPHGFEQNQQFTQVGPLTWKGKHRTGAVVFLVLRKPGSGPHDEFVRHCGLLPDVMEAPPTISDEWVFENGKFVHYWEV